MSFLEWLETVMIDREYLADHHINNRNKAVIFHVSICISLGVTSWIVITAGVKSPTYMVW